MHGDDALWESARVRALIAAGDVGGIIRLARQAIGWRQADLGHAAGYSASTISRLETGDRAGIDLEVLQRVAHAAGIPAAVFGALASASPSRADSVTQTPRCQEGDPMRRRALIATSLAVPAALLTAIDDALALPPEPTRPATSATITTRLTHARHLFDTGNIRRLLADLPDLVAAAELRINHTADLLARHQLADCYTLATEALNKVGSHQVSRLTADRATTHARLSGSPVAMAVAARALSIVLRHEGRPGVADRVTLDAANRLEGTGLRTTAERIAYAQMLCTCAYTAATTGDRARALELITDAARAAATLSTHTMTGLPGTVTPAHVTLYEIGIHWALGDAGAAIDASRRVRTTDLPTPERRARLHTDVARAWWQWGKPEPTARALLTAHSHSPAEVTQRPRIRAIAARLIERHPHTSSVRHLAAAISHPR